MFVHALKKVNEPLTGDVVADEDKGECVGVKQECVEHKCEDAVHVAVSKQCVRPNAK